MLTLWKRHSATCLKTKNVQNLRPEQRRFYKKCGCACWVTGNHPITKAYLKQSLGTADWKVGEKLMRALEIKTPAAIEIEKMTIEAAFKVWLADKRRIGVGEATLENMYAALMVKVLRYARDRGLTLLSQLQNGETYNLVMSPIWNEWKPATSARQLSNLRAFFNFAIQREWINKNPVAAIDRPKPSHVQADPFTPEEESRLETAFREWAGTSRQGFLQPATLLCLVHVLRDSGLRISDALRVRPAIITILPSGDGECTLRQNKMDGEWSSDDGEVTIYLRRETIAEMGEIPWASSKYPFMLESEHEGDRRRFKQHLTAESRKIYHAMQLVGKEAGVTDCRAHRWRHSFAVKLLLNGWDITKVSRLLGHRSVATTMKFYSKWTRDRRQQLREEWMAEQEAERAGEQ